MSTGVKIERVEFREGYVVRFWLSGGRCVDRNFLFLRGGVFEPIWRDPRKFRRLRIVGGVPTWPGGVDLCPDVVLRGIGGGRMLRDAVVGQGGILTPATPTKNL